MAPSTSPRAGPSKLEITAAIVLGALAIGCFVAQALTFDAAKTTTRETALFSILQFLLTTGFAWFSTRAVSRNEFEESLKRFAIGAYRRVADTEQIVRHLRRVVQTRMVREGSDRASLTVIEAVVRDAELVVASSIADWADVIGDELTHVQQLRDLRAEENLAEAQQPPTEAAEEVLDASREHIRALRERIARLESSLPPPLRFDERRRQLQLSEDDLRFTTRWMRREHLTKGGFVVEVGVVPSQLGLVSSGEEFHIVADETFGLDAFTRAGAKIGRVFNTTPMSYPEFSQTLLSCFPESPVRAKYAGLVADFGAEGSRIRAKVTSAPRTQPRAVLRSRKQPTAS